MTENQGVVWWSELATRDVMAAKDYYATVCGWSFDEAPMEGAVYNVARIGERMIAGIFDMSGMPGMNNVPAHWMTYLASTTSTGRSNRRAPLADRSSASRSTSRRRAASPSSWTPPAPWSA